MGLIEGGGGEKPGEKTKPPIIMFSRSGEGQKENGYGHTGTYKDAGTEL